MKTIHFKTDGNDRYFTPSVSFRRRDETEEDFLNRCARKVVPEGKEFDILENALYSGFIQTARHDLLSQAGFLN